MPVTLNLNQEDKKYLKKIGKEELGSTNMTAAIRFLTKYYEKTKNRGNNPFQEKREYL